jgi:hypothetical protein
MVHERNPFEVLFRMYDGRWAVRNRFINDELVDLLEGAAHMMGYPDRHKYVDAQRSPASFARRFRRCLNAEAKKRGI